MSNIKYATIVRTCLGCGKSLGTGYLVKNRKYCSNKCQMEKKQKDLLDYWLTAGAFKHFTGGVWGCSPRVKYVLNYISQQQEHRCAICNCSNIYNNQPLIFVIDHIDGDCSNNNRSNLRLICPNCDSQTATYKNRNKGKGRKSRGFRIT